MTMNRHEPFEELISASLTGDLTEAERRRLDAHLDGCDQCRQTLAAFPTSAGCWPGCGTSLHRATSERGFAPGVESASIPWWRKPTTIFTAVRRHPGSGDRRAPRPRRAQRLAVESNRPDLADADWAGSHRLDTRLGTCLASGRVHAAAFDRRDSRRANSAARGDPHAGSTRRPSRAGHDRRIPARDSGRE